jgi:PGF-pre-PGF domain-containing protein
MKNFNEETGVKEIQIQVKDEIQNVKITVSKFDEKPVSVSVEKTGKVHKYFQIKTENLETDLKKATVTIQVEKSWISNNSLNKDDIALFKFDNSSNNWNELTTTYKEEDDEYYYYDAELTSFSYFAISEKVVIEEEIVEEKTEEIIDGNKQEESINKGLILWWILVIVLILAILILILIIIRLIKPKRGDIDYIQPFKPIIQQPATEGEEWQQ